MTQKIPDETLNALIDGEIKGPLKSEISDKISSDPNLLARYHELTDLKRRIGNAKLAVDLYNKTRSGTVPAMSRFQRMRPFWANLVLPLVACVVIAGSAGFYAGNANFGATQSADLSGTWIYRATGAHQLAMVDDAWLPATVVDELPASFAPLLENYRGEAALQDLGYQMQGWRIASDGHAPVALQLVYRDAEGSVATAFIREHVEGQQSSMPIVINGVPAYFTGQNNVDTALIGLDLPYEDTDWQANVRRPV